MEKRPFSRGGSSRHRCSRGFTPGQEVENDQSEKISVSRLAADKEFKQTIASELRTVTPNSGLVEVKEEPEEFYGNYKDQKRVSFKRLKSRGSRLRSQPKNDSDSELTEILEETQRDNDLSPKVK